MNAFRKGDRVNVRNVSRISVIGGPAQESVTEYVGTVDKKTTYGGTIGYNIRKDGETGIRNEKNAT